ncbi:hypothetical protein HDE_05914 [Halotydeus destructor]|nr:hypothetical protein HDE_05914 [Halotydeus destructor]
MSFFEEQFGIVSAPVRTVRQMLANEGVKSRSAKLPSTATPQVGPSRTESLPKMESSNLAKVIPPKPKEKPSMFKKGSLFFKEGKKTQVKDQGPLDYINGNHRPLDTQSSSRASLPDYSTSRQAIATTNPNAAFNRFVETKAPPLSSSATGVTPRALLGDPRRPSTDPRESAKRPADDTSYSSPFLPRVKRVTNYDTTPVYPAASTSSNNQSNGNISKSTSSPLANIDLAVLKNAVVAVNQIEKTKKMSLAEELKELGELMKKEDEAIAEIDKVAKDLTKYAGYVEKVNHKLRNLRNQLTIHVNELCDMTGVNLTTSQDCNGDENGEPIPDPASIVRIKQEKVEKTLYFAT